MTEGLLSLLGHQVPPGKMSGTGGPSTRRAILARWSITKNEIAAIGDTHQMHTILFVSWELLFHNENHVMCIYWVKLHAIQVHLAFLL
jgi:hypothetical protein